MPRVDTVLSILPTENTGVTAAVLIVVSSYIYVSSVTQQ